MARLRLSEACARYAAHCQARKHAASSIRTKLNALGMFRKVTGDLLLDSITGRHVDLVFNSYNWAPTTRNSRVGIYKAFFSWCRGSRYMNPMNDPMIGWRQAEPPQVARLRIAHAEWPRLFEACQHPQERIVVATGLYLFLRASEQRALKVSDVDFQNNRITVWRPKTKKTQLMPMSSELLEEMRAWFTFISASNNIQPDHYLICGRNRDMRHDPLTYAWVAGTGTLDPTRPLAYPHRVVQRVMTRAGFPVEKGQGEHTLRRSGARAYFDHLVSESYDGALRQVQTMLGHKHSRMTEVYLGIDLDNKKVMDSLAGKPMFTAAENVTPLRKAN